MKITTIPNVWAVIPEGVVVLIGLPVFFGRSMDYFDLLSFFSAARRRSCAK
jgi:hypothetical protein